MSWIQSDIDDGRDCNPFQNSASIIMEKKNMQPAMIVGAQNITAISINYIAILEQKV